MIPKLLIPGYFVFKRSLSKKPDLKRFSVADLINISIAFLVFWAVFTTTCALLGDKPAGMNNPITDQASFIVHVAAIYSLLLSLTIILSTIQNFFTMKDFELYLQYPVSSRSLSFGLFARSAKAGSRIFVLFFVPFFSGYLRTVEMGAIETAQIFAAAVLVNLCPALTGFLLGTSLILILKNKARFYALSLCAIFLLVLIGEGQNSYRQIAAAVISNFSTTPLLNWIILFTAYAFICFKLAEIIFDFAASKLLAIGRQEVKFKLRSYTYGFNALELFSYPGFRMFDPAVKAIALKEHKLFTRDLLQSLNFAVFLFLFLIYLPEISVAKLKTQGLSFDAQSLHIAEIVLNQFFAGVVLVGLANRFAYPSFSLERENSAFFKYLPVKFNQVLKGKVIYWCIPFSISSLVMFSTSALKADSTIHELCFSFFLALITTYTVTTFATALGAIFKKEAWNSITEVTGSYSSFMTMIICSMIMLINCTGGLFLLSVEQLHINMMYKDLLRLCGILVIGGINISATLLFTKFTESRIRYR